MMLKLLEWYQQHVINYSVCCSNMLKLLEWYQQPVTNHTQYVKELVRQICEDELVTNTWCREATVGDELVTNTVRREAHIGAANASNLMMIWQETGVTDLWKSAGYKHRVSRSTCWHSKRHFQLSRNWLDRSVKMNWLQTPEVEKHLLEVCWLQTPGVEKHMLAQQAQQSSS